MSRRARQRQDSRPWQQPSREEPEIDWTALAAERQRREQQQQQKGQQ